MPTSARKSTLSKSLQHLLRMLNRLRLHNRNFSLITNTCIGGIVYHDLGLRFLSPTINCGIRDHAEFFTFCIHLRHYLSLPLDFITTQWSYPVATLHGDYGDVTVYFSHYKTREQAADRWEERKGRVNWDNIVVLMDGDNCTPDQVAAFAALPQSHKVIFTMSQRASCACEFPLNHPDYKPTELLEYGPLHGALRWYELLDVVQFLNSGRIRRNPLAK